MERERERVQNNKQVYKLWTGDFDITSKTAQQTGDRQKKKGLQTRIHLTRSVQSIQRGASKQIIK